MRVLILARQGESQSHVHFAGAGEKALDLKGASIRVGRAVEEGRIVMVHLHAAVLRRDPELVDDLLANLRAVARGIEPGRPEGEPGGLGVAMEQAAVKSLNVGGDGIR